ncbi:MAG: two-component regulator propeller domain-containing protein, partial [Rubricoccaceae bacterium]
MSAGSALALPAALAAVLVATGQPLEAPPAAAPDAPPANASLADAPETALAFTHLTTEGGLAGDLVTAVAQDALGFVWIGTTEGLTRYDGYAARTFGSSATDTTRLPDSAVQALLPAEGGALWVGTADGLARYDPATERFARVPPRTLPSADVLALAPDPAGALWVGTARGLACLEPSGEIRTEAAWPTAAVQALARSPDGALWIGTDDGLFRRDPASGQLSRYRPEAPEASSIAALWAGERGELWVGTLGGGLLRFDPRAGTFAPVPLGGGVSASVVSAVYEDREGVLWVGTFGAGLYRLVPGAEAPQRFRHEPGAPTSLGDDMVSTLFEDRQGVFWVGTYRGLGRFDRARSTYVHFRHDPDDARALSSTDAWALLALPGGGLLVGTDRSLDMLAPGARAFTHTPLPGGARALLPDGEGGVWVGTPGGLWHLDAPGGRLRQSELRTADGTPPSVSALAASEDGTLWIGTDADGVLRRASDGRAVQTVGHEGAGLAHNTVHALTRAPDGTLWIGTAGGLCRLAPTPAAARPPRATCLDGEAEGATLALHVRSDGTLFAGTDAGLLRVTPGGAVRRYSPGTPDLPEGPIAALAEDRAGFLWLSTTRGLVRFDPVTETFQRRLAEGPATWRAFTRAGAQTEGGRLFFAGPGGVLAFYPEQLAAVNPHPPQVVLTEVTLAEEPVVPGPHAPLRAAAPVAEAIRLRHDQNYVTFFFAALHFADPAQNRYRFRMDGSDDDWRDAGRERKATYTNLPPGRYTFRVQGASADGVWSPEGAALSVVVRPPWWRRWWAYALYLGLLGLVATRLDRWQRQRLLRVERERAERREAELRAEKAEAELARARAVEEANARLAEANARL